MRFPDDQPETVKQVTDDEFFDWIIEGLRRKHAASPAINRKPATPAQLAFTYAACWLLGSAVILALVCGVLALVRLLFSLTK